jgi:hypothetical protein
VIKVVSCLPFLEALTLTLCANGKRIYNDNFVEENYSRHVWEEYFEEIRRQYLQQAKSLHFGKNFAQD